MLLVADTPWQIWIAGMASALAQLVKYLGERDVRIAESSATRASFLTSQGDAS